MALIPVLPFHKLPSSRGPYKFSQSVSREKTVSHAVNLIKDLGNGCPPHRKTSRTFLMAYYVTFPVLYFSRNTYVA